jgi:hypothetical protein
MTDLDARAFRKRDGALIPVDEAASEMLAAIKDGQEVLVTIRKARSPEHHRFFFAMLHQLVRATGRWSDEAHALDDLKQRVGHVTRRIDGFTGHEIREPRSINFGAMDELAFGRFTARCRYVIARDLGIDVDEMMADQPQRNRRAA